MRFFHPKYNKAAALNAHSIDSFLSYSIENEVLSFDIEHYNINNS